MKFSARAEFNAQVSNLKKSVTVRTALSFTDHEKELCVLGTRNFNSLKRRSKLVRKCPKNIFAKIREIVNKLEHVLQLVNETQLAVTNRQKANLALHLTY